MPPDNKKTKKNLAITLFDQPKTIDILNQMVSSIEKPFELIERYTKEHFHAHTKYGVLIKDSSKAHFKLCLYKKANRKNFLENKVEASMTVDAKDNIIIQNNHDVKKLILLKQDSAGLITAINFSESIQSKKIIAIVNKNPYFHDHFIYLSVMNTKKATDCYQGFLKQLDQIKKEFKEEAYTTDFLILNDHTTFWDTLKKKLEQQPITFKLKGKIYFLVHAHCNPGSDILMGESPDNVTQWNLSAQHLVQTIRAFNIPNDMFLDIDIFACSPGRFIENKPSFCFRLNTLLTPYFSNVSIKGNMYTTYSNPALVLCESPRDVAWSGMIREPLSSKEQMQQLDVYQRILYYPIQGDEKLSRNQVIAAFKHYAKKLVNRNQSFFYRNDLVLKHKLERFEKLENLITAEIKRTEIMVSLNNNCAPYQNIHVSLLKEIEDLYKCLLVKLNFSKAIKKIKNLHVEYGKQLYFIKKVYDFKIQLLRTSHRHFIYLERNYLLLTIKAAEKGEISFEKAWNRLCSKNDSVSYEDKPSIQKKMKNKIR
jgi:hypothetical protein